MTKLFKKAAIALAAGSMAAAAPASATIFEYEMTNGDILTIDNEAGTGTWKGNGIDVSFSGPELTGFQGGATPNFMFTLANMTGTRTINGTDYTPTTVNGNRTHPWMLKSAGNGSKINLWSWWGDPVVAGDYVKHIGQYTATEVPAPGMLGLFGLALVAFGIGRRNRKPRNLKAATV